LKGGKYTPAHISHIADVVVDAGCVAAEAARRLRSEGEPYAHLKADRIRGWVKNNTHDFNAEIVAARERKGERDRRRQVEDPIATIERLIGDINERHERLMAAQAEAITVAALSDADLYRSEQLLLKQEGKIAELTDLLAKLKNPKEGEAASEAVVIFAGMLINRASPRQRDVIASVVQCLLPEGSINAG